MYEPIPFIQVHCISSKPGNQILRSKVRTNIIMSFAEANNEYIQVGAAAIIDLANGSMFVVKESFDDIDSLIVEAEKVKV